jgi:membrane fusion protein, heavy metal efflux system
MKKAIVIGVVVLVGIIVVVLVYRQPSSPARKNEPVAQSNEIEISEEAQQNSGIEVAEAQERTLADQVVLTGVVAPDEAKVAHIVPLAQGVVERIFVKLGDRIDKGASLVALDIVEMGELAAERLRIAAQFQTAKAKLNVAQRSLDRAENLLKVEAISKREYDERLARRDEAQAEVASRTAELLQVDQKLRRFGLKNETIRNLKDSPENAGSALSRNMVRAPFAGIITKFNVAPGELVSSDKEMFTLVDPSSVWVVADVYEKDIGRLATGATCEVAVSSYPNQKFKGIVADISDFLDPQTRTAKVRCVVPNRDRRLKLDMFANVTIPSKVSRTVLAIPSAAVQQVENQKAVFVQANATHFEKRDVEIGAAFGEWVEVKSGVRQGEKLAAKGSFYVKSVFLKEQLSGEE